MASTRGRPGSVKPGRHSQAASHRASIDCRKRQWCVGCRLGSRTAPQPGIPFRGYSTPLLWGLVGAIASLVPFVGATLVWVPAVIGFVVTGSYWKAIVLGLWGLLVVGSIDNILRPLVIGARDKQNPVLVGFAMLGGTYAIGPLGLLIGPLVVSLTGAVVEEIHKLNAHSYDIASGESLARTEC